MKIRHKIQVLPLWTAAYSIYKRLNKKQSHQYKRLHLLTLHENISGNVQGCRHFYKTVEKRKQTKTKTLTKKFTQALSLNETIIKQNCILDMYFDEDMNKSQQLLTNYFFFKPEILFKFSQALRFLPKQSQDLISFSS